MLTVEMTSMPAARMLLDVLPALLVREPGALVWASSSTSTSVGTAAQDGVDVHLGDRAAAVLDRPAGHDLEIADLLGRARPPVGLDEADDDVGAALAAPMPLVEHGERLADARRRAEVDAHRAGHIAILVLSEVRQHPVGPKAGASRGPSVMWSPSFSRPERRGDEHDGEGVRERHEVGDSGLDPDRGRASPRRRRAG